MNDTFQNMTRWPAVAMNVLACPKCQAALLKKHTENQHVYFFCRYCRLRYRVENDVAYLRPKDGQP